MIHRRLLLLLAALFLAFPAAAEETGFLRVRLARTQPEGEISPELQDVADVLMRNLNLRSCILLHESVFPYPKTLFATPLKPYRLIFQPQGEFLSLTVFHRKYKILNTTVRPSGDAPVIIGGLRPNRIWGEKPPRHPPPDRKPGPPKSAADAPPEPAPPEPGPPDGPALNAPKAPPPPGPESHAEAKRRPPPRFAPGVRDIIILERVQQPPKP